VATITSTNTTCTPRRARFATAALANLLIPFHARASAAREHHTARLRASPRTRLWTTVRTGLKYPFRHFWFAKVTARRAEHTALRTWFSNAPEDLWHSPTSLAFILQPYSGSGAERRAAHAGGFAGPCTHLYATDARPRAYLPPNADTLPHTLDELHFRLRAGANGSLTATGLATSFTNWVDSRDLHTTTCGVRCYACRLYLCGRCAGHRSATALGRFVINVSWSGGRSAAFGMFMPTAVWDMWLWLFIALAQHSCRRLPLRLPRFAFPSTTTYTHYAARHQQDVKSTFRLPTATPAGADCTGRCGFADTAPQQGMPADYSQFIR